MHLSDVLRHLVKVLTLPLSLDDTLCSLATLTRQAMGVDLCVIMLMDELRGHMSVRTCLLDLSDKGVIIEPIDVDSVLWGRLRDYMARGQLPELTTDELESLNPLKNVQYKTLLPLPLIVGAEYIGVINCYSSKTQYWTNDDQLMLITIASQAALAIKHLQHVEADVQAQKNLVTALFDDLLSGKVGMEESLHRRAYLLGCDLTQPHAVVVVEMSQVVGGHGRDMMVSEVERLATYKSVLGRVKQRVQANYPGSLVDERDNLLVCLLSLAKDPPVDHVNTWFDELVRQVQHEQHVWLSAGIGNLCHDIGDYRRGYTEAKEALEIGHFLNQGGSMTHFNTLGVYRYIYQFARTDTLHDRYQSQIVAIAEYDRRKKAKLLDTLEAYLECGGNTAKACIQLGIHRNTMLQRMERLQSLCTLDLEQYESRLPLLVALKVYKLRAHGT